MHMGKNQDQYNLYSKHISNILNNALELEVFPSALKGLLWGHCFRAKGV